MLLVQSLNDFYWDIKRFKKENGCTGRLEEFGQPEVGADGLYTVTTRFLGIPGKAIAPDKKARRIITVLLVGKVGLEINGKSLKTAAYNTEALYCDHKAATPKQLSVVHGFHFDYEDSAPQAHPIFHAHYDLSASSSWYTDIDRRLEIENMSVIKERREHRAIRIPTAPMDIFSVVLMIVAGHWIRSTDPNATKSFSDLLSKTEDYIPAVDLSRHKNLYKNQLLGAGVMLSHAWYPV